MHICLLYSENAGDGESTGSRIRQAIEAAGHEVVHLVEKDTELSRALDDAIDLVVAAGGDGTVARAAAALAAQPVPLAVLPLGTANNIAANLGISGTMEEVISTWSTLTPVGLDLGILRVAETSSLFIEGVGAGLIPRGIVAVPPDAHGPDDSTEIKLQRAARGYRDVLRQLRPQPWGVTLDGEAYDGAFLMLEILNMATVGPSLVLTTDADPHDGWLSVVLAEEAHRAAIDAYLADRAEGRNGSLDLPTYHAREIDLRGVHEAHVDDHVRTWSPSDAVSVRIEATAVRVLRPVSASEPAYFTLA
jgi:diacylglycerol kinase (ATP)